MEKRNNPHVGLHPGDPNHIEGQVSITSCFLGCLWMKDKAKIDRHKAEGKLTRCGNQVSGVALQRHRDLWYKKPGTPPCKGEPPLPYGGLSLPGTVLGTTDQHLLLLSTTTACDGHFLLYVRQDWDSSYVTCPRSHG